LSKSWYLCKSLIQLNLSGLQSRLRRFDPDPRLQKFFELNSPVNS
jgi:hypothetical protein